MACACNKSQQNMQGSDNPVNNAVPVNIALEPVVAIDQSQKSVNNQNMTTTLRSSLSPEERVKRIKEIQENRKKLKEASTPLMRKHQESAVLESMGNGLARCYLCAKKHLVRAKIFFEEYHTGYPDHMKNLIESLQVATGQVKFAFLAWQQIMGHLDMASNELLGKEVNIDTVEKDHLELANKIRDERLKLSDNPLYVPDFDSLLVAVQLLQHQTMEKL